MQDYPHIYRAGAIGRSEGEVRVTSPDLESFDTASPPEFGGPGGLWSPETLLVASVVDCFILTFRSIARASQLEWHGLDCTAEGRLEKVDRVTRFTEFNLRAALQVPEATRPEKAERLLQKAEEVCLITNSMSADVHLETHIEMVSDQQSA